MLYEKIDLWLDRRSGWELWAIMIAGLLMQALGIAIMAVAIAKMMS